MTEPMLLLLAERSSGFNDSELEGFMSLLWNIRNNGISILLVEHNTSGVVSLADDIRALGFGGSVSGGNPFSLFVRKAHDSYEGGGYCDGK